jgi:hypothetical protein
VDTAAIIAGYAAVVATGSLGWQVYQWRHRRRSHVEVRVRWGLVAAEPNTVHAIIVTAVNRSEHRVRLTGFGLYLQDGSGDHFQQWRPFYGLPTLHGHIEPHDSEAGFLSPTDIETAGIDPHEPVTAWVQLATGETVNSSPTRLRTSDAKG